jgi:hypothetical protein
MHYLISSNKRQLSAKVGFGVDPQIELSAGAYSDPTLIPSQVLKKVLLISAKKEERTKTKKKGGGGASSLRCRGGHLKIPSCHAPLAPSPKPNPQQ